MPRVHLSSDDRQAGIERIKEHAPKGSTIYCILRSVSRSGMSRRISFYAMKPAGTKYSTGEKPVHHTEPVMLDRAVAAILDMPLDREKEGIRVDGCGMDMGFHVVYSLARAVYGTEKDAEDAGYVLKHRWL